MEYPEIVKRNLEAEKMLNGIAGPFKVPPFNSLK
jgi:hypothetical protein